MSHWQAGLGILLAVAAAGYDLKTRRIPNRLLLLALAGGAACLVLLGDGASPAPRQALAGLGAGFILLVPFYALRWMGAGDVKLMATIGFLLGQDAVLPVWAASCLTLAAHTFFLLAQRRVLTPSTMSRFRDSTFRKIMATDRHQGLPYGVHLGLCTAAYLLTGGFDGNRTFL